MRNSPKIYAGVFAFLFALTLGVSGAQAESGPGVVRCPDGLIVYSGESCKTYDEPSVPAGGGTPISQSENTSANSYRSNTVSNTAYPQQPSVSETAPTTELVVTPAPTPPASQVTPVSSPNDEKQTPVDKMLHTLSEVIDAIIDAIPGV